MEVYTIDSILNLMLLCVELTNIILCNDKSTSSFILDLVVHEPTAMTPSTNLKICTNKFDETGLQ